MRNASSHQSENEQERKKKVNRRQVHIQHFLYKTKLGRFWKFHVVVVKNKGKEMYKKLCCTCRVVSFFSLIRLTDFFTVFVAPISY